MCTIIFRGLEGLSINGMQDVLGCFQRTRRNDPFALTVVGCILKSSAADVVISCERGSCSHRTAH